MITMRISVRYSVGKWQQKIIDQRNSIVRKILQHGVKDNDSANYGYRHENIPNGSKCRALVKYGLWPGKMGRDRK